jgi:sulfur-oxidizing protein SoxB
MLTRRDFLQVAAAAAAIPGWAGGMGRAAAAQSLTQEELLRFQPLGQVTLLQFTDIHAQLMPLYFREPSVNLGMGEARGRPPHLTGKALLDRFGLKAGSPEAYAFSSEDFAALAKTYGKIGGLDRMATLVKAIRAERPGRTLLVDCGDTWQGSYTSLKSQGEDMVRAMNLLGVEAMTAHWEFTYGQARVKELVAKLKFPFLCGNVKETQWEEDVFEHTSFFERGGIKVALIGQAFPYTPIANPRWMMPEWSFGIRDDLMQKRVDAAREAGADLVVVASHNGFDVDYKMAGRVKGIDVLLTGHTHDAMPEAIKAGQTLLVAPGSHGKFLGRLDLEVKDKRIADYRFRLIPIFSDAIRPDPEMAALIKEIRQPHEKELSRVLAKTEGLLFRRGNFNGSFDDLILDALMAERDAEIALSPGFRWGSSLPPGSNITLEDVYNQTAITYPAAYRMTMSGKQIKDILEDVADNLFHPDPYYQQGGDMVRVGGLSFTIDPAKPIGGRINNATHLKSGKPLDPAKDYVVAGWASVNQGVEGPPVYDVLVKHLERVKTVKPAMSRHVTVAGG